MPDQHWRIPSGRNPFSRDGEMPTQDISFGNSLVAQGTVGCFDVDPILAHQRDTLVNPTVTLDIGI